MPASYAHFMITLYQCASGFMILKGPELEAREDRAMVTKPQAWADLSASPSRWGMSLARRRPATFAALFCAAQAIVKNGRVIYKEQRPPWDGPVWCCNRRAATCIAARLESGAALPPSWHVGRNRCVKFQRMPR